MGEEIRELFSSARLTSKLFRPPRSLSSSLLLVGLVRRDIGSAVNNFGIMGAMNWKWLMKKKCPPPESLRQLSPFFLFNSLDKEQGGK
jgi:hypothetical protein